MFHSTYRGVNIYRNPDPNKLPWTAVSKKGDPLAADTLGGIRSLIKGNPKLFSIQRTGDPHNKTGWDINEYKDSFDERYCVFRGDISPMQGRENTLYYLRRQYPGCIVRVER